MTALLQQANYILDACGRPVSPAGLAFVPIPAHIGYSRFMPSDPVGTTNIGSVMHDGRISFVLRAVTAQALPRDTQGVYWRLRLPDGKYFQNQMTSHAMAFGFGSNRQLFSPEIEWAPGEKLYIDLDTILAGPPPSTGYTVSFMFEGAYRFEIPGAGPANPLPASNGRYFLGDPNQNILAPEFRFGPGCPLETPDGYQDEGFTYVTPTSDLPITGAPVSNVGTQIEAGSDFVLREIWPFFLPSNPNQGFGSVVARFRRGDGYVVSSSFLPVNAIQGPVFKELRIKSGDNFYYDAAVVDGGGAPGNVVTAGFYLMGVKRRKVTG
jgi:hypothetical protein